MLKKQSGMLMKMVCNNVALPGDSCQLVLFFTRHVTELPTLNRTDADLIIPNAAIQDANKLVPHEMNDMRKLVESFVDTPYTAHEYSAARSFIARAALESADVQIIIGDAARL